MLDTLHCFLTFMLPGFSLLAWPFLLLDPMFAVHLCVQQSGISDELLQVRLKVSI